ncbi:F-box/LRR-repeat protein At3g26922-like [Panicum virgatum]|uniref:F-box/LRR-repeat protein At3g26922-like n=1 Tax=Panicum virgatum TaxID=38727 RepID=UPI0019D595D2|nr:F-box/LRR-repeat protein At3g26922-like [Panicum virgatum]
MLQEERTVNEIEPPEDRTRTLPDEILEHVISFLPAQEAVQTCVLAKHWCHLWKSMPTLRIIANEWLDEEGVKKLNMFIKSLLLKRNNSAQIDVCEVEIGEYSDYGDDPQVDQLVRDALLCQARIIRITVSSEFNWVRLGGPPFISQHLTRLELTQVDLQDDVLDYSSCLALKNILMRGCFIQNKNISSQFLEELTIINCTFHSHGRAHISAPSLVRLELVDCDGATPMIEGMPSLIKATIRLYGSEDVCGKEEFGGTCSTVICHNCGSLSNEDFNRHCVLMKGLSGAESLELMAESGVAPDNWDEMEGSYDPSAQPLALSKKLKLVEIHYDELDRRVHNVIRIMKSHPNFEEVNDEEPFENFQEQDFEDFDQQQETEQGKYIL